MSDVVTVGNACGAISSIDGAQHLTYRRFPRALCALGMTYPVVRQLPFSKMRRRVSGAASVTHYSIPTRSRLGFRVSAPGCHLAGQTSSPCS